MGYRSVFAMLAVALGMSCPASGEVPAGHAAVAAGVDPLDDVETLGYQPLGVVSGTLRLAGSTTILQAAANGADGLAAVHPDLAVTIDSGGSDSRGEAIVAERIGRPMTLRQASAERDGS